MLVGYLNAVREKYRGFAVTQQITACSYIVCFETLFLKLLQPFCAVVKSLLANFQFVKTQNQCRSWVGIKKTSLSCQQRS